MTTGSTGTKRRTLLQRGLALLAGGAAIGGTRWAAAASPPTAVPSTVTLYARQRPTAGAPGASGDMFDRPDGERIGSFYTNCFAVQSPFGGQASASGLEFHVMQLPDGTLFSMGNGAAARGVRPLAIVGGTGRFAGKTGSCIERTIAGNHAGDDVRELIISFAG